MRLKARYLLLSTVSALALSGTASAQTWTGFYVGGHGGFGWLRNEQAVTGNNTIATCNFPAAFGDCKVDGTGAVGGVQVGYNWLVAPQWLIGVEADGSLTSFKKSQAFPTSPGNFFTATDKIDWLASVRGRVGYAAGETLFYVTGGVAFLNFDASWAVSNGAARAVFDSTTTGWVVGGGVERAFSARWSLRAEFLHYGFSKSLGSTVGGTYTTAFRHDVSVVRLGINFRTNP